MQDLEPSLKSHITMLPMELHFRIRYHVLRNPSTTFNDYKALRLVCKDFEIVWSPVVLNHLVFFPSGPAQLRYLKRNSNNNLALANKLTIKNWHKLNTDLHWFLEDVREAQLSASENLAPRTVVILTRMVVALTSFAIIAPARLMKVLVNPTKIPRRLKAAYELHRARRYANSLPYELSLPNVHCARLNFRTYESNWVVKHTTKILLALPQLTELELTLPQYSDMSYIARCLTGLRTLRKLTVETYRNSKVSHLEHFGLVIAHNPDLTHLTLPSHVACNLSSLFRHIPPNCPLKLEHLGLGTVFTELKAIIPHIRSLKSFHCYGMCRSGEWILLSNEGVFPPVIQASSIDSDAITYLGRHPGIISLSWCEIETREWDHFYSVLAQHSNSLQSVASTSRYFSMSLSRIANESNLLRCANIKELVLVLHQFCESCPWDCCGPRNIHAEEAILPIIGRLSSELTVVVTSKPVFDKCIEYCDTSDNLLVRDLKGRIVYERRPPVYRYC